VLLAESVSPGPEGGNVAAAGGFVSGCHGLAFPSEVTGQPRLRRSLSACVGFRQPFAGATQHGDSYRNVQGQESHLKAVVSLSH